jgi:hypothetical protein
VIDFFVGPSLHDASAPAPRAACARSGDDVDEQPGNARQIAIVANIE